MKTIFHIDLDSFFVSAERLKNPALRGKCVAVGGSGGRGVISSASYEARKHGVRSAMPTSQAMRLCPQLIIVGSSFDFYSKLSHRVFEIVHRYSPVVEQVSVDEGYLDMTGTEGLWGPPETAAAKIKSEIFEKTGLTCSIGIGTNRLISKIATDFCKPNGIHRVPAGTEAQFLAPMEVRKIPGIGPSTEDWLNKRAIFTVADLQRMNPANLDEYLVRIARGEGSTEFHREAKKPSISRETTFEKNLRDPRQLEKEIRELTTSLGQNLREDGKLAHTLKLKLRYPPFETVSRSKVLDRPSRADADLYEGFLRLFRQHWDSDRPLRLLGVGCTLMDPPAQMELFDRVENLKEQLRQRFGINALRSGRDLPDSKDS